MDERAEVLTNRFDAIALSAAENFEFVQFNPPQDEVWIHETFKEIPRYLFRVSTPHSDGTTTKSWTKSKNVRMKRSNGNTDIFELDKHKAAAMVYGHLDWVADEDNLISWTSSLLFALRYAIYLNRYAKVISSSEKIELYIVDTTMFPKQVFIQDLILIEAFKEYNIELKRLEGLRTKPKRAGRYYFGEYLCQGLLKIENKCQMVSAKLLVDHGLRTLSPELWGSIEDPGWARRVLEIRQHFYQVETETNRVTEAEISTVIKIANLFGSPWRLPVTAYLLALRPRGISRDFDLFSTFHEFDFTELERLECCPSRTKIFDLDIMPEVKQFKTIMESIYTDFCFSWAIEKTKAADKALRSAMMQTCSPAGVTHDSPVYQAGRRRLLQTLDEVDHISKIMHRALS